MKKRRYKATNVKQVNSEWQPNLNRLEASLSRHWPELIQQQSLRRISLLSLIGEYGSPQEVAAHRSEAQQLMRRIGRGVPGELKIQA
jgi:hypothetical protein